MNLARLLKVAVGLLLVVAVSLPVAAASRDKKEEKAQPAYPNATRVDPEIQQSRRLQKKLIKMYDLSQGDDPVATEAAAKEVGESDLAGTYEKALAAQIIGHTWLDRDDYPQAIASFIKAVEANGLSNDQHYQTMYLVAQLYVQEEDYDNALVWLDRFFAETKSEKAEQIALKGNVLYRMERFQDTVDTMKRAMAATPNPQPAWAQILMAAYADLEQYEEAGKLASELLAKNPDDKALVRNLAAIYINGDMNDQAIAVLEGAKQRGMLTEERDYKQLYQLYHYAEKEPQAIATIQEGLDKGILPATLETYRTLAEANYFAENITGAIAAYQKAAPLATDGEISLNLARVLYEEGRWAEAKQAVAEALAKGVKRKGDAYIVLGGAELESDNRDAAIAAYREAAKYPETETNAKAWLRSVGVK